MRIEKISDIEIIKVHDLATCPIWHAQATFDVIQKFTVDIEDDTKVKLSEMIEPETRTFTVEYYHRELIQAVNGVLQQIATFQNL